MGLFCGPHPGKGIPDGRGLMHHINSGETASVNIGAGLVVPELAQRAHRCAGAGVLGPHAIGDVGDLRLSDGVQQAVLGVGLEVLDRAEALDDTQTRLVVGGLRSMAAIT